MTRCATCGSKDGRLLWDIVNAREYCLGCYTARHPEFAAQLLSARLQSAEPVCDTEPTP